MLLQLHANGCVYLSCVYFAKVLKHFIKIPFHMFHQSLDQIFYVNEKIQQIINKNNV